MASRRRTPDQGRRRRLPLVREQTVNERLLDLTIERAHLVERLKAHEVRQVEAELREAVFDPLVTRTVSRTVASRGRGPRIGGGARDPLRMKAMRDLTAENNAAILRGYREARQALTGRLGEIATEESRWQVAAFKDAVSVAPGVAISFIAPTAGTLRAIADGAIVQGEHLRGWFDGLARNTARRVEREIAVGIVEGDPIDKIARRLRGTRANGFRDGVIETSMREARNVTRTAVGHVSSTTREATYAANEDLVSGVMWVATLDHKTCPVCASNDSRTFPVGEGERPTAHLGCRCTTVPQIRSWRDLGFDVDETPPSTRASMDGQVAESLTYPEWLNSISPARQREALGPARFRLFEKGATIDQFVDRQASGRPLTVAQISRRTGLTAD